MTSEEKNILEAFLSKTLNLDGEAISGLYNAEGELTDLSIAIDADAKRITKYKTEKQNEFNRGIEKGASKIEKAIKEKYNIDSDLIGVDLLDHVIELQTSDLNEKLKAKNTKDEDFEKHPKYLQFKQDFEKQLKAKDAEWEDKLKTKESEWVKKETFSKVSKVALSELETGYIMPENAQRTVALKDVLLRDLEGENYSSLEDGTIVLLDKDGKPKEDQHGKMLQFNDYVHSIAGKYFDKKVANARENSGNTSQSQQTLGSFKTEAEFLEASRNAKTPQEQAEVYQKFKSSKMN